MALPNPGMDFAPFSTLPAESLDQMVENIESLSSGDGIENLAISTSHMKPNYVYKEGDNGSSTTRQIVTGTTPTVITGSTISYSSGDTPEVVMVRGRCIATFTASGAQTFIGVNGSIVGQGVYNHDTGIYREQHPWILYEIAANTAVTFSMMIRNNSGNATVANTIPDRTTDKFGVTMSIMAFGR